MLRIIQTLLAAGLLALAGCAAQAPRSAEPAPLLLVSIDGFRPDYLERGVTPTLRALADGGVRAKGMRPSFPSKTFPNHYTLVTGLYPDHHGIVGNTMYDPVLGRFSLGNREAVSDGRWWEGGEPVWVTAGRHGLRTATMFWPGSEAEIRGSQPDHWLSYDGAMTPVQRVDRVLDWLDLPDAQRPDFLTLYFDRVDHAGHEYGPDSPEVDGALSRIDDALATLVAGLRERDLYDRINLVVVSDHGMAPSPPEQVILVDDLIDPDRVQIVSTGVLAGFNPLPGYEAEAEDALLRPHEHMHCWEKSAIPARLNYGSNPRVPAISCSLETGWRLDTRDRLAQAKRPPPLGMHGYDNADPLMRALFVAQGPAFRRGLVVGEFSNVDVYPLLTHLLGIPAQPNDGDFDAVRGMLRASSR